MKLTVLIFFAGFMSVSASTLAQKVTLNTTGASLKTVLNELKKQSGYDFVVDEQILDHAKPVTLHLNNTDISAVLDQLFSDEDLTYSIEDKVVTIKDKQSGILDKLKSALNLDKIDVHGRVIGIDGQPLVGATVKVKNSDDATSTDADGYFTLKNIEANSILVVSFIGYQSQELTAKSINTTKAITLQTSANKLNEVVINKGYYNTTQELNTGDVSSVSAKQIEEQPVSNVLEAAEGRIPGMQITQNSGMPGSSYTIQIRGKNSIQNGNSPLFIVDGVPYISSLLQNSNPAGGNPLDFLNPQDILSFDVLKDADATAIYGSRGANGVVLITTKKGKAGKTSLNATLSQGIGEAPLNLQWLNTAQYLQMRNEAFKNDNEIPTIANAPDLLFWDTNRYTDWQKTLIGGKAQYSDAEVSLSGGSQNLQYIFSTGYHRETTVFPANFDSQKLSGHFNIVNTSADKKFQANFSGNYLVENSDLPKIDLTSLIQQTPPDAPPVYNADGSLNWAPATPGAPGTWFNPYNFLLKTYGAQNYNLNIDAVLSYELAKGLQIKSNFGYNYIQSNETTAMPIASQDPGYSPTGFASATNNNIHSWIVEPQINYQFSIGKNRFEALLGSTFEEQTSVGSILNGTGYTSDALINDLQAAPNLSFGVLTNAIYKYNALFGRLGYNYEDKYLLNLTVRRDGSSRFGPDNQFHNFGAVGAAWIFSKEKLVEQALPFLSFGKLRASYGTTGNDQIGDYAFYDLYKSAQYTYNGQPVLTPNKLYNPYLAWEETKKLEAGLELGFLDNRIMLDFDYYNNRSSNELVPYKLSTVTGFNNILLNFPATVENYGYEVSLTTTNIKSSTFRWTSSFNLTIPKNELLAFPNLAASTYASAYVIGQPITIIKVFQSGGVDPATGVNQYIAANGSLTFSPNFSTDQTVIENSAPKFYGGLQNSFTYKRLQLDVFLQFVKQTGLNDLFQSQIPFGIEGINWPVAVLERWQHPGDNSPIEKFTQDFGSPAANAVESYAPSNAWYTDASFMRLKNLSISYQLPDSWKEKLGASRLRVFLQGENLLTITKYKGMDPENQSLTALPPLRVLTAGIDVGF